jgi:hypothetical protein
MDQLDLGKVTRQGVRLRLTLDVGPRVMLNMTATQPHESRLLVNWTYDRGRARLGRGGRWVALIRGCPLQVGVTHTWHASAGHRGAEWLKRGMPSSK